ncbi:MAG TPA: crosslink repair DNA glycosylase YcaQ family protein [Actinomycetota bacterium]|nr:crosslink repair DNA glycosylase YcaQ family protein [Actinomycetota bacterium]
MARSDGRPVSLEALRRLAIVKQGLAGPRLPSDTAGVEETVRRIRCLQLDPTSAVARSHLLVLWSRVGPFDPGIVDRLAYRERWLFEYWAHAASLVMAEDYPLHRLLMLSWIGGGVVGDRLRAWMADNDALRRTILRRLRREGPLGSRAFADLSTTSWTSTGWTNERNVERMLTFLWGEGKVGVAERTGGRRLWDLAERCLPDWATRRAMAKGPAGRLAAELSVRAIGAGRPVHIQHHFVCHLFDPATFRKSLESLERSGTILRLRPTGDALRPGHWFVHADDLSLLESLEGDAWQPRITMLSPFDNLIRDRVRTAELFGFDYRLEIYTPKAKRRFGYFVMPVLDGDRLIARMDPAFDRTAGQLDVHSFHVEEGVSRRRAVVAARAAAEDLATFLGARAVAWPAGRSD